MKQKAAGLLLLSLTACASSSPRSPSGRGLASVQITFECKNRNTAARIRTLDISQAEANAGIAGNLYFDYNDTTRTNIYDLLWRFGDNTYTSLYHRSASMGAVNAQGHFNVTIVGNSVTDDAAGLYDCHTTLRENSISHSLTTPPHKQDPMPTIYHPGDVFIAQDTGMKITVASVSPNLTASGVGASVRMTLSAPRGNLPHATYDFILDLTPDDFSSAANVNYSEDYSWDGSEPTDGKSLQIKYCKSFPDPQCKSHRVSGLNQHAIADCHPALDEQFIFNPTPDGLELSVAVKGSLHVAMTTEKRCLSGVPFVDLRSKTIQFLHQGVALTSAQSVHCVSTYPPGYPADLAISDSGRQVDFSGKTHEGDGFVGTFACTGHFVSLPNEHQVTHYSIHETASCTAQSASLSKDFLASGQGHISIQRNANENAYFKDNIGIYERGYDCGNSL